MKHVIYIVCVILAWMVALINDSGYGATIHSVQYTYIVLCAVSFFIFVKNHDRLPSSMRRNTNKLLFGLILLFVVFPLIFKGSTAGLEYLSCVLVVYCMSHITMSPFSLFVSAVIVVVGGLYVINQYLYGSLDGWNENGIAMISFFSYLYYAITFLGKTNKYYKFLGIVITAVYMWAFMHLDNRSCFFGMVLVLLVVFFRPFITKIISQQKWRFLVLNIPLIIALLVIWTSQWDYVSRLNIYSLTEYNKSLFNGRDFIWRYALDRLSRTFYLGEFEFTDNYHNSAIACLSVFGVMGYIVWIKAFSFILKQLEPYLEDLYVYGCVCVFLIIFIQQSVELGFIRECPNLFIYTILGLAVGRARNIYISKKSGKTVKYNHTSIQHGSLS